MATVAELDLRVTVLVEAHLVVRVAGARVLERRYLRPGLAGHVDFERGAHAGARIVASATKAGALPRRA